MRWSWDARWGRLGTEDLDMPKGSGSRDSKLRSGTTRWVFGKCPSGCGVMALEEHKRGGRENGGCCGYGSGVVETWADSR